MSPDQGPPALLLVGARVHGADSIEPSALLIRDGRLAWSGPILDAPAAPSAAGRVDLGGALVLPAFVDAHVHTTATGIALTGLDLHAATSLAQTLDRLAEHVRTRPGETVLATGWDETTWPERRAPTRPELDRAAGGAAVYLARVDVHSAVASSALLDAAPGVRTLAGYDPGGHVRLDAHHAVRTAAQRTITDDQRRRAQRATRARAAGLGVAAIHEMAGPEISGRADLVALLDLAAAEPGPRVVSYWGELGEIDVVRELGLVGAGGDLFCDGTLGSHTAAVHEPYTDRPGTSGALRFTDEEVAAHLAAATAVGVQAGFHCIGDAAIDQIARGLEAAAARYGDAAVRACRHRLEHLELPGPQARRTMARLAVVGSVQPCFDAAWGGPDRMYAARLGRHRSERLNPFAELLDDGIELAFGSDAPVTPIDPWAGLVAAVAHRTPRSRTTVADALRASTEAGWRAARDPRPDCGTLRTGAPAHLAVWDTELGPAAVVASIEGGAAEPRCLLTVADGEIIFTDRALDGAPTRTG